MSGTADQDESGIAGRLEAVRRRIAEASARSGRDVAAVRLVAVSKTHPASAIREAWDAGQRLFGENYVQELVAKADALSELEGLELRFIGHLQRNKAKDVVRVARAVETVDSARLGEALARRAGALGRTIEVFVQVNVGGEAQKSGCTPDALAEVLAALRRLPELDVRGLMTVPPYAEDAEASRPHFRHLRSLAEHHGLAELSMGMSGDLEVAVEEGATLVRVGSAIFGPRSSAT